MSLEIHYRDSGFDSMVTWKVNEFLCFPFNPTDFGYATSVNNVQAVVIRGDAEMDWVRAVFPTLPLPRLYHNQHCPDPEKGWAGRTAYFYGDMARMIVAQLPQK